MNTNTKNSTVKMTIHAGGAWEGHVVYTAIHPRNPEISSASSNLEEVVQFCDKHDLLMDEQFVELVKKSLIFETGKGYVIAPDNLDPSIIITSAGRYLKSVFGPQGYYG